MVPEIHTERLRLRAHTAADLDAVATMWGDPAVTRFIGGTPLTREESWARMLRYAGHWVLLGHGPWLMEEKATGRYAGDIGFWTLKREIDPPFDAPEQGWVLAQWAHGRGYATEAGLAILDWARTHFGPVPFVCMISPDNTGSIRVAEKLGYREFARTSYRGAPSVLFRRVPGS